MCEGVLKCPGRALETSQQLLFIEIFILSDSNLLLVSMLTKCFPNIFLSKYLCDNES